MAYHERTAHLRDDGADPDADEQRVAVESVEDVALSVDLAGVDLVEQRHHDERVEDDGEVLRWRRMQRHLTPTVDVKYQVTCIHSETTMHFRSISTGWAKNETTDTHTPV